MATLKNRNQQTPGGLTYYQPETGWKAPSWRSFDTIVQTLIDHRRGNPYLLKKHGWAIDPAAVAFEVDAYNAKICQANGWFDFIIEASPDPPKLPPQHWAGAGVVGHVKRSAAGIKLVMDWLGNGLKPVPVTLAEKRAPVCATLQRLDGQGNPIRDANGNIVVGCPQNSDANWIQKLDAGAAQQVKNLLEVKSDMALRTSQDDKLHVCQACDCTLVLKVWTPIDIILANTSEEQKSKLDPKCWITAECAAMVDG